MRTWIAAIAASLSLACTVHAAEGSNEPRRPTDIPAQLLKPALKQLSNERHFQIVFLTDTVGGIETSGAKGNLTTQEALNQILAGTGLTYRYLDDHTLTVVPLADATQTGQIVPSSPEQTDDGALSLHLAEVDSTAGSSAASPSVAADNPGHAPGTVQEAPGSRIEEIIVTAQKRSERLQDVPVPVTAIGGQLLVDSNQLRLQDYYVTVPGLSVMPAAEGVQNVSIRGITTGPGTNPTVGITIDDVPYGSSTGFGGSGDVPDFDPDDLARVEVLRGPQGTLYGASSMGGLVKYVTVDPSTDALSGRAQAGISDVYNGAQIGYNVRGSINVPLGDTLAARASAFTRIDPGYIDNPVLGINGVNRTRVSGGRFSALWKPVDGFSLKLSALYQDYKADGSSDVDVPTAGAPQTAGLGDLQQNYIRGAGGIDRRFSAYSATVNAKVGDLDLTAISGYNANPSDEILDATSSLGPFAMSQFNVSGALIGADTTTKKFTQEIRLSSPVGGRAEWLVGAFYTHENSPGDQPYYAADPTTGQIVGNLGDYYAVDKVTEYAAFADVTAHITDRFDVQVGGRESKFTDNSLLITSGRIYGDVATATGGESSSNAFTYLLTPRFKISRDVMVYARFASGYRAGGANIDPGKPAQYDPDKTQNYEIGAKATFLDNKLSLDASLYDIDWKNIQVLLFDLNTFASWTINANRAHSRGVEFSVEAKPVQGLTLAAWVSYDDAALTSGFPPLSYVYGVAGDRLPYTSPWSGSISLQQDLRLTGSVTGFFGGAVSYVGDRDGMFTQDSQRQDFPAYTRIDLRSGVRYGSMSANLSIVNLTDKRAQTLGGLGSFPTFAFNYIQPRMIELNLVKQF